MKLTVKSILLTGLSGAGKTTLANMLSDFFELSNLPCTILDGDVLRKGLNSDLNFTREHRKENARRIAEVAKLFCNNGIIPIIPIIAPYQEDRSMIREILGAQDFFQIFVYCPLDICITRDPKGLYLKANLGIIKNFTGISSEYQEPNDSDLMVNTHEQTTQESFESIINRIVIQK
ncbi:adenylyl-sulfate kinase [Pedobacter caeni]|uniref:Adenylyl-sulfate kinase n=1 Tax=Pedobacter caeni TaxID=288992 RepID=A0A1M5HYU7_9SPHI|nr:adenylyl-sulfate kinase [Pedobacter caeni]SHG21194.1 adenylylsulfate kinase [Pedobacter caeni]